MKFAPFSYLRATDAAEAVRLLAEAQEAAGGARFIAGGQSLLPALAFRLDQPATLIDIGPIAALRGVTLDGGRLRIGALTTHAMIERDPQPRHNRRVDLQRRSRGRDAGGGGGARGAAAPARAERGEGG
jgi:carbon-monoxide dehydrogenase medium subunit